jgi:hypothetical protein
VRHSQSASGSDLGKGRRFRIEGYAFVTADSTTVVDLPSVRRRVLRKVNTSSFDTIDLDVYARFSVSRCNCRILNLLSLEIERAFGLKQFRWNLHTLHAANGQNF